MNVSGARGRVASRMRSPVNTQIVEILLIEDNPGDVRLTREALADGKIANRLTVAPDATEALAILRREGTSVGAPTPDLILLDLNLPGMSGREFLHVIKSDDDLKRIPVVVLTTAKEDETVLDAYGLAANSFITKPVDYERFIEVVREIGAFWFSVVRLPSRR